MSFEADDGLRDPRLRRPGIPTDPRNKNREFDLVVDLSTTHNVSKVIFLFFINNFFHINTILFLLQIKVFRLKICYKNLL